VLAQENRAIDTFRPRQGPVKRKSAIRQGGGILTVGVLASGSSERRAAVPARGVFGSTRSVTPGPLRDLSRHASEALTATATSACFGRSAPALTRHFTGEAGVVAVTSRRRAPGVLPALFLLLSAARHASRRTLGPVVGPYDARWDTATPESEWSRNRGKFDDVWTDGYPTGGHGPNLTTGSGSLPRLLNRCQRPDRRWFGAALTLCQLGLACIPATRWRPRQGRGADGLASRRRDVHHQRPERVRVGKP
jgi:hypothetical protein